MPTTLKTVAGGNYELTLPSGRRVPLPLPEAVRLIRACVGLADELDDEMHVPPYVVAVELDYSDFGVDDQDTRSYGWAVKTDNHALARAIKLAADNELEGTEFSNLAYLPVVPETEFRVGRLLEVASVEEAIADLRQVLVTHSSDSVIDSEEYWKRFGLGGEGWSAASGAFDPIRFDEEVDLVAALSAYEAGREARLTREDLDAIARLRAWVAGKSPGEVKATTAESSPPPAKPRNRKRRPS